MIVSTTLAGGNADIIGDALRSVVDQVDQCIVIDTRHHTDGKSHDGTLDVARNAAGDKLCLSSFPWTDDFSEARNFALRLAAEKADWAVTVDTDERLIFKPGFVLRDALSTTARDVLLVMHEDGSYMKERIVRLPTTLSWYGPTHEALGGQQHGKSAVIDGMVFRELGKTYEQVTHKYQRDIEILTRYTEAHPDETRWLYYLGASLQDTGQWAKAIAPFERCAHLRGWDEEGAWACFRAGECHGVLKHWDEAVEICAYGLALHPGFAELAWLAAWATYSKGDYEKAIAWAHMSIANGMYSGAGERFARIGFRRPFALYEGPFDILQWCYNQLGDVKGAAVAAGQLKAAKMKRESARS